MPFHEFTIPVNGKSLVLIAHETVVKEVDKLINYLTKKNNYTPDRIVVSPLELLELQWYFFHDINLYAGIKTPFVPTSRWEYRGVEIYSVCEGEILTDIRRVLEEAQLERANVVKHIQERGTVNADILI